MRLEDFEAGMEGWERHAGSAVFLTSHLGWVPLVGKHVWLRENCRYDNVLLLKVDLTNAPYVDDADRVEVRKVCDGFFTGTAQFGFMENPRLGAVLPKALPFDWKTAVVMLPRPALSDEGAFGHHPAAARRRPSWSCRNRSQSAASCERRGAILRSRVRPLPGLNHLPRPAPRAPSGMRRSPPAPRHRRRPGSAAPAARRRKRHSAAPAAGEA